MSDLDDERELAADVLRRLESNEPLASILPAARRLMSLADRPDVAFWILLEEVGVEKFGKESTSAGQAAREAALATFLRVRSAADPDVAIERVKTRRLRKLNDRSLLISAPIADLERQTAPDPLPRPTFDEDVAEDWLRGQIMFNEGQRVVARVRTELHERVLTLHATLVARRARRSMFGADAEVVFQAGGALLVELANSPLTLERTGAYLAAQEARTALMKLGRELYKGPQQHVSPFDGKTYDAKRSEMHSLAALLGDLLRSATDPGRQEMLRTAFGEANRAYDLGSKAKTPTAITHDEAAEAMRLTYRVARALAFSGAFSPPSNDETN